MLRIVVSLDENDKSWLKRIAKRQHLSIASIIRRAIDNYRNELERQKEPAMDQLLQQTKGIWQHGDGLAYQQKLRDEWDNEENT